MVNFCFRSVYTKDVSGEALNPYNESASAKYPNGTQALYGTPTASGQVIYKDNNDGTVDVHYMDLKLHQIYHHG